MFAVFFGVGIFMIVPRSRFIWDAFESLRFMQFPWRYMGLVSIASAGLAGAWLALLRDRPLWLQAGVAAALIGVFISTGHVFFEAHHRCTTAADRPISCPGSDAEYFADSRFSALQRGSIKDYLPAAVEFVPRRPPEAPARVVQGPARVLTASRGSDWLRLQIEADAVARVEAALFDFPQWQVKVDGSPVSHTVSPPRGLVSFEVLPGAHEVEIRLQDTFARRWANRVSLVAWAALALSVPALLLAPELGRLRARLWSRRTRLRRLAEQPREHREQDDGH
jgi:hypothetical protein